MCMKEDCEIWNPDCEDKCRGCGASYDYGLETLFESIGCEIQKDNEERNPW